MIMGFLFCLDGVITNTANYEYEAWKELADELHIAIDLSFSKSLKDLDTMVALNRILEYGEVEESFTQDEKIAMAVRKKRRYHELISHFSKDDVLPGILTFLQELRENHFFVGLASLDDDAPEILSRLEINDYFDVIVDAREIIHQKSDPGVFIKGQELLRVAPTEVIGIGADDERVEGIKKAGMFAIGIGEKEDLENADLVVKDTPFLNFQVLMDKDIL